MRIGFTGTGGTGKSTTLEYLVRERLVPEGVPVLGSTTRSVFQKWNLTEAQQEQMSAEDRWRLQKDIFDARLSAEAKYESGFISDRTILDNMAYSFHRCYPVLKDEEARELEDVVYKNLLDYDFIFYFPIYFDPPDDGMRQLGYAYRRIIDAIIREYLQRYLIRYVTVPGGSPEERARWVGGYMETFRTR